MTRKFQPKHLPPRPKRYYFGCNVGENLQNWIRSIADKHNLTISETVNQALRFAKEHA
jgi:hypothetical protein